MITTPLAWTPAALLCAGVALVFAADRQHSMPLRLPLATIVPTDIAGFVGEDLAISPGERQAAGVTSYLYRVYASPGAGRAGTPVTLYVGYYDRQARGRTIHSPKNCLPGAGWQTLVSRKVPLATSHGVVTVNHYLVQRDAEQALVLYWYQGRGRVEADEYVVKWNLLRDSALRGRTEEALVRVVVPVRGSEHEAFLLAARVAGAVLPALPAALPT